MRQRAQLDRDEGGQQQHRDGEQDQRPRAGEAVLERPDDRVDEQHEAGGHADGAGDVEAPAPEVGV